MHGCDYLPPTPRFGVHYELLNMERVERLHVKALLDDPGEPELPEIDSCVELFPTADFQEREIYDMFGIVFRGHPDLRRILMPEEYEGFPQRRDFPMGGEPVLFTHNEHADAAVVRVSEPRASSVRELAAGASPPSRRRRGADAEEELMTINFGPHHPATHGVLRLLVTLRGEEVLEAHPVHRLRAHRASRRPARTSRTGR